MLKKFFLIKKKSTDHTQYSVMAYMGKESKKKKKKKWIYAYV